MAVLTVALGVGAPTAVFSLVDAAMLQRLPYPHANRLLWITAANRRRGLLNQPVMSAEVLAWQRYSASAIVKIAYGSPPTKISFLSGSNSIRTASLSSASANFFALLGARPLLGRLLERGERPESAVISYRLWQRWFSGASNVIGRKLKTPDLVSHYLTIIGVLPHAFAFGGGRQADIWIATHNTIQTVNSRYRWAIGLLDRGVPTSTAAAALTNADRQLAFSLPAEKGWRASIVSLHHHFFGHMDAFLIFLFGAAALVLFLAGGNFIALMLARAINRQREMALRIALGASQALLARQLLAEALLIALAGTTVGFALAEVILRLLLAAAPISISTNFAILRSQLMIWPVLVFGLATALIMSLIVILTPVRWVNRLNLCGAMRGAGIRRMRIRAILVVSEMAIALVLLLSALLLIRSFMNLMVVPLGFRSHNLLSVNLTPPKPPIARDSRQAKQNWAVYPVYYHRLLQRVRQLPYITGAGVTNNLPLTASERNMPKLEAVSLDLNIISPGYLNMVGTRLLSGRYFGPQDTPNAHRRIILSRSAAAQLFPHQNAIGRQIKLFRCRIRPCKVIGIVQDTRQTTLKDIEPIFYESIWQDPTLATTLVIRARGNPSTVAAEVRTVISNMPPLWGTKLRMSRITEMNANITAAVTVQRFRAWLLTMFAGLALALAVVGMYGVLNYLISQSVPEIGVRMALGATPARVLGETLSRAGQWLAMGAGLGLLMALGVNRLLHSFLFGISSTDPLTFFLATGMLVSVGLLAAYFPARRAANVNPIEALRRE